MVGKSTCRGENKFSVAYCPFQKQANFWSSKATFTITFFTAVNHNYDHKQRILKYNNTFKLTDRNPPIKNHKPWAFEPIEVNLCFLRGLLRWLTAATNANVSWLLNFTICMFMKSAVNWEYACILPATIFFTYLLPFSLTVHVSEYDCVPFYPSHVSCCYESCCHYCFCFFLCAGAGNQRI